jgi:hypothetical protein
MGITMVKTRKGDDGDCDDEMTTCSRKIDENRGKLNKWSRKGKNQYVINTSDFYNHVFVASDLVGFENS